MAAYSKNNAGNVYLPHSTSVLMPNGRFNSTQNPALLNQTSLSGGPGLGLTSQTSIMQTRHGSTMGGSASPVGLKNEDVGGVSGGSGGGAGGPGSDGPALKKSKTTGGPSNQAASTALFPPSSNPGAPSNADWSNLAALEPPLLVDRGFSALGGVLGDRGLSVLGVGGVPLGDRGFSSLPMEGVVGSTPFATLGTFQTSDEGTELPDSSVPFGRAGSTLNVHELLNSAPVDESGVDAIHVTATPFGFPAFSASTTGSSSSSGPSLLGFYQYDSDTTYLSFVPLSRFPSIRPEQVRQIENIYRSLRTDGENNPAVSKILTRQQCVTLQRLKEEALLTHYASQTSGFLTTMET